MYHFAPQMYPPDSIQGRAAMSYFPTRKLPFSSHVVISKIAEIFLLKGFNFYIHGKIQADHTQQPVKFGKFHYLNLKRFSYNESKGSSL